LLGCSRAASQPGASASGTGDTIETRFTPPAGFVRVEVSQRSFGAYLRALPLLPAGSPVVTFAGKTLHEASHPNIAAVAALDIGTRDLQQCADSVIRLHAEWQWSLGRRDQHYKTAAGGELFFAGGSHASFRRWLDEVFASANTASLANQAKRVDVQELQPGDFVVMRGVPFGHAVMILDVAKNEAGRSVVLLGQGFMPAQSFHVLRRSSEEVWFPIDEASAELVTPFWQPFPFSSLRRL
jgi:hypothetical protein